MCAETLVRGMGAEWMSDSTLELVLALRARFWDGVVVLVVKARASVVGAAGAAVPAAAWQASYGGHREE